MRPRRGTRAAAEDHLVAHELAVVFAQRTRGGAIAGIGRVRAGGPLPDVAEQLARCRPGRLFQAATG